MRTQCVHYTYYALGRQTKVDQDREVGDNDITEYSYDSAFGWLTQVKTLKGATEIGQVNYTYDNATGRVTSVATASSSQVDYTYDNQGRLKTVTTSKRNGGAVSETTTYTYTLVGSRATVTYPNYVETSYAYNSANQLTEVHIQDISGSPTTLAKYEYSLGLNGRRNSVVETDNDANETAIYFGYDALGRLTHETHADYQIAYTYDLVGNRLSKIRYAAPVCERYLFRKIGQPDTYVRRKRLLAERVLANC